MIRRIASLSTPFLIVLGLSACQPLGNAYENIYYDSMRPELEKHNSPFIKHDHRRAAVTQSVYCYRTLGQPMCYHQKHMGQEERLLGYFEVESIPDGAVVVEEPQPAPVIVHDTRPAVVAPQTLDRPAPPPPTPDK